MAVEFARCRAAMVSVGFVVEGKTEEKIFSSRQFALWAREECRIEVAYVVSLRGNANMVAGRLDTFVEGLRVEVEPDKLVVVADLDPSPEVPCIAGRKALIGSHSIDLIIVATPSIESWFLADTIAMRKWSGDDTFFEKFPEQLVPAPWERLKGLRTEQDRGPGSSKPIFARKFIQQYGFSLTRAATHPACPSAAYAVARLKSLAAS